jgi:hypothetical protein
MTKAISTKKQVQLWKNQKADFPAYGIPPLPKFVVSKELRGLLVVTPDVRKAWIKYHLVGEALDEKPISQRARDWFWRAAILVPKTQCQWKISTELTTYASNFGQNFQQHLNPVDCKNL